MRPPPPLPPTTTATPLSPNPLLLLPLVLLLLTSPVIADDGGADAAPALCHADVLATLPGCRCTTPNTLDCSKAATLLAVPPPLAQPPSAAAANITSLLMQQTTIQALPARGLQHLADLVALDVSFCALLTSVHVDALQGLPNLETFSLQGAAALQRLLPGTFRNLPRLSFVSLRFVSLRVIEAGLFANLPALHELSLAQLAPQLAGPTQQRIGSVSRPQELFHGLHNLKLLDISEQPVLVEALDWELLGRQLPALESLSVGISHAPLNITRFASLPQLATLKIERSVLPGGLRRADLAAFPALTRLQYAPPNCSLSVPVERGAFGLGNRAFRHVLIRPNFPCIDGDPAPTICEKAFDPADSNTATFVAANSEPLRCTSCPPGHGGDGTFCEPLCPSLAVFNDPVNGTLRSLNCSSAERFRDALCCIDDPSLRPSANFSVTDCPSGALVCGASGVWSLARPACPPGLAAAPAAEHACEICSAPALVADQPDVLRTSCRGANTAVLPLWPPLVGPTQLFLSRSGLTGLRAYGFASLAANTSEHAYVKHLDLGYNDITLVAPEHFAVGLSKLFTLSLRANPITTIMPGTFAALPELDQLILASTLVSALPPNLLYGMPKLRRLNIGGALSLRSVSDSTLAVLPNLAELQIENALVLFGGEQDPLSAATQGAILNSLATLRAVPKLVSLVLTGFVTLVDRLERHRLAPVDTAGLCPLLRELKLSYPRVPHFTTLFAGSLQALAVHGGSMQGLYRADFPVPFPLLTSLELFLHPLTVVEAGAFDNLPALTTLIMSSTASRCTLHPLFPVGSPARIECDCAAGTGGLANGTCEPLCLAPPAALTITAAVDGFPCAAAAAPGAPSHQGDACLALNATSATTALLACRGGLWQHVRPSCGGSLAPGQTETEASGGDSAACVCEISGTTVFCKDKALTAVPLALPSFTTFLDVSGNPLRRLPAGAFAHTSALKQLSLVRCQLEVLDRLSFRGLENTLTMLFLHDNMLTVVDIGILAQLHVLEKFVINGNTRLQELPIMFLAQMPHLNTLAFSEITALKQDFERVDQAVAESPPSSMFAAIIGIEMRQLGVTAIPDWVRRVKTLQHLIITGNPIRELSVAQFANMSRHLTKLTADLLPLGSGFFLEPLALAPFPNLTVLGFKNSNFNCNIKPASQQEPPGPDAHLQYSCVCFSPSGVGPASGIDTDPTATGCIMPCPELALPPAPAAPLVRVAGDDGRGDVGALLAGSCSRAVQGDLCSVTCADSSVGVGDMVLRCEYGQWMLQSAELCDGLASPTPVSTTAAPTLGPGPPAPPPTMGPSGPGGTASGTSGGSGGDSGMLVGAIVGVVVLVAAVLGALVVWQRRRSASDRKAILGELRELMMMPNTQAREAFAAKYSGLAGDIAESDRRLRRLELADGQASIDYGTLLGQGEFGRVVLGSLAAGAGKGSTGTRTLSGPPTVVAVKTVHEDRIAGSECVALLLEARVLSMLDNPNLVRLLAVQLQRAPPLLLLEFCNQGDLRTFMRRQQQPDATAVDAQAWRCRAVLQPEPAAGGAVSPPPAELWLEAATLLRFGAQIAAAMEYMHSKLLLHRDLAARNVLVHLAEGGGTPVLVAKLADLGLTREHKANSDYYRKTSDDSMPVRWMCPIALALNRFSKKSDVWSYGVLLWEMWAFGQSPYSHIREATQVVLATQRGYRLPQPAVCPDWLYQLLLECWAKLEIDRPTFTTLVAALNTGDTGTGASSGPRRGPSLILRQGSSDAAANDVASAQGHTPGHLSRPLVTRAAWGGSADSLDEEDEETAI